MLLAVLTVVHVLITLVLIFLVLIQDSKGGGLGGLGGGGNSNTLLGATGTTDFVVKFTRWVAIAFAISCISLAMYTSKSRKSVVDDLPINPSSGLNASLPTTSPSPSQTPEVTQIPKPIK